MLFQQNRWKKEGIPKNWTEYLNEKKKQVKRYAAPSTIALLTMDERKRGHFYLMKLITTPIPTIQNVCLLRMLEIECSSLHSHYCFGCRQCAVSCAHFATATYIRFTASFLALLVLPTAWAHRTNIIHTLRMALVWFDCNCIYTHSYEQNTAIDLIFYLRCTMHIPLGRCRFARLSAIIEFPS